MKQILVNIILLFILVSCNNDSKKQLDLINQKVENQEFKVALELIQKLDFKKDTLNFRRVLIKKQFCENRLGLNQEAINTLEEIVNLGGTGDKQYLNQIAIMYYKNGNIDKAIETMERLKRTGSKFGLLEYFHLGLFEFGKSNYAKALANFDSASVVENYRDIYYYKSLCEIELGLYDKAIENLNKYEKLDTDNSHFDLFLRRAFASQKLNKMADAEKDLGVYMHMIKNWDKQGIQFFELSGTKNNAP